jgi:L-seryl-tRNA(Ser) seleniumtransferase
LFFTVFRAALQTEWNDDMHDEPKKQQIEALKKLPAIDALLKSKQAEVLLARFPRAVVVRGAQAAVARKRRKILKEESVDDSPSAPNAVRIDPAVWAECCRDITRSSLRRVINATGVVVHTNLGRSPLPASVLDRLAELAAGYCTLEYDLETGARGSRHAHAAHRLTRLLGTEDCLVVNNNAAAVLVSLAALAAGRRVVVSRGELVEIGGSFRIPDVMRQSGALLIEVGTTNRTRIADYAQAIAAAKAHPQSGAQSAAPDAEPVAMLLKVHRSNFAVVGFSEEATPAQIATLGRKHGIATMMDLGSGLLESGYTAFPGGFFPEAGARNALDAGVDIVTFSGDKLLGGPQAGIVAGKKELVGRIRSHPLVRAVRPGKLTFAALDAVLSLYEWDESMHIPAVAMICADKKTLKRRRTRLLRRFRSAQRTAGKHHRAAKLIAVELNSKVGGGASPLLTLPSAGVAVEHEAMTPTDISAALRRVDPPIIGRIADDRFLLDMRTVADAEIDALIEGLYQLGPS